MPPKDATRDFLQTTRGSCVMALEKHRIPVTRQRLMRPTRFELATFGLKDRRSLGPRRDPLTTELRARKRER